MVTNCTKFMFRRVLVLFAKIEKSVGEVCLRVGEENDESRYTYAGFILL